MNIVDKQRVKSVDKECFEQFLCIEFVCLSLPYCMATKIYDSFSARDHRIIKRRIMGRCLNWMNTLG